MVFAALNTNIVVVSLLAVCGGLWFDSLSADPLGLMILPLFAVGFPIFLQRDLILRELPFAQVVLGGIASAVVPLLAVLMLLTGGQRAVAGLGLALAMDSNDRRRRRGHADFIHLVSMV